MPKVCAPWTAKELEILLEVYPKLGRHGAKAALPNRSLSAIKQHAERLNLRMDPSILKEIRREQLKNNIPSGPRPPRLPDRQKYQRLPDRPIDEFTQAPSIFDVAARIKTNLDTKCKTAKS